jgi:hypothetical protein
LRLEVDLTYSLVHILGLRLLELPQWLLLLLAVEAVAKVDIMTIHIVNIFQAAVVEVVV